MTPPEPSRTLPPRQGTFIIGAVLALGVILGLTVLPTLNPVRSQLVRAPAPPFTLPVLTGGDPGSRVSLGDLKHKVVLIDFWASWCGPCRAETPIVDQVARHYAGKDVVVLGIATSGDERASAAAFATSEKLSYATLFDADDQASGAYRIQQLPTLVVVDRAGVVTAVRPRMVHEDELEALIDSALGKS